MSPLGRLTHLFHRHDSGSDGSPAVESREPLEKVPADAPVTLYVVKVFHWLLKSGDSGAAITFSPDQPLAAVDADTSSLLKEHPDDILYRRVVNRLKILCDLNPWPSNTAKSGVTEMVLDGFPCRFRITVQPGDSGVSVSRVFEGSGEEVRSIPEYPPPLRIAPLAPPLARPDAEVVDWYLGA